MNRIMNSTMKRITARGLFLAARIISPALQPFTTSPAVAATTLPVLWTAGGLSNISKTGYTFDAANSVLTKSITQ